MKFIENHRFIIRRTNHYRQLASILTRPYSAGTVAEAYAPEAPLAPLAPQARHPPHSLQACTYTGLHHTAPNYPGTGPAYTHQHRPLQAVFSNGCGKWR